MSISIVCSHSILSLFLFFLFFSVSHIVNVNRRGTRLDISMFKSCKHGALNDEFVDLVANRRRVYTFSERCVCESAYMCIKMPSGAVMNL